MKRKAITQLAFENLSFAYENGPPLFENISFELPGARAVWVRSPGGRGKSTFLRLLAGLISPQGGSYLINGEAVSDMSFEEFLHYRMNMGYGFDFGGLLNNMTIFDNLALPLRYHKLVDAEEAHDRVHEAVEMFGLGQVKDLRPFSVSGSHRKLACMIRAFIHWPQVALLDDPVTGLKEDNLNDLFYYIQESYATRGLRQVFFTGESPIFAQRLKAEELMISTDWFTSRAVA